MIRLFILALVIPFTIIANSDVTPTMPKLTLSAQATLHKPADELQLTVGVVNFGDNAETALTENSAKMQEVIKAIEEIGLSKSEYETGHFDIHPTYAPHPKDPPPDWKPKINGYEVSNSVSIKTSKLDIAGKLVDAVNKAGANRVENIRFVLHDSRTHWNEAISAATANAISDAKTIAVAASVRLVRLVSIALENANVITPRPNQIYFARAMASEVEPPIEPGEVTITANVSLIYEIVPN